MRARTVLLMCVFLASIACSNTSSPSASDSAGSSAFSKTTVGIVIEKAFCKALTGTTIADAVKPITTQGDQAGWKGALLADIVMATASAACTPLISKAEDVVASLFDPSIGSTSPVSAASIQTFQNSFTSQAAVTVASRLGVSTQTVEETASAICDDLGGTRLENPVAEIRTKFPNAGLSDLGALNGLIWLVLDQCSAAGPYDFDGLTQGVLSYLMANSLMRDTAPPVVFSPQFSQPQPNSSYPGTALVTMSWIAFDEGGIAGFSVWDSINGAAYQIWPKMQYQWSGATYTTSPPLRVNAGSTYVFALQAEDTAGNWSPWTYSGVLRT